MVKYLVLKIYRPCSQAVKICMLISLFGITFLVFLNLGVYIYKKENRESSNHLRKELFTKLNKQMNLEGLPQCLACRNTIRNDISYNA